MTMRLLPLQRMTWIMAALLCLLFQRTYAQQVYANSQTNGVTGLCLACSVTNPNNAVNNSNLNDYAQLNMGTGIGTVTVYQTLIFPSAGNSCDSLVIGIGASGSPADNPYTNVTVQTYNGNTANNDAQTVDNSVLRQLQGYGKAEILLKPQQIFNRVRVTLTRQGSNPLTNLRIFYAYRQPGLQPPLVTDSTTICMGATAVLTATPTPGSTVSWYSTSSGGQPLATGNQLTVTPDVTTTYYAAAAAGGCVSARKPVIVIVNKLPMPDIELPTDAVCGSQLLTVNNYQPGLRYLVHITYTADTLPVLDTAFTVIDHNTIFTPANRYPSNVQATLFVQAIDTFAGCRSDTLQASFTAGGIGMLPTVAATQVSACQGSTITLHAFTDDPQVPVINWYDAPSGGNLLYSGDYFTLQADSTATYYVTSQAQCEFPQRVAVQVITSPRPPAPVLGVADTLFAYRFASVTLTATAADSAVIRWYRSDTATTAVYTGNSYRFNVLTPGTLYFYAGAEQQGCISLRKQVVVIVSPQTTPPAARSVAAATVVKQPQALPALQLYPNPASGEVRFTGKDLSGSVAIIRDVNGREVQREVLQRNGLNISRLTTAGIYFIQVISKDHEVYNGKVLLQR